MPADTRPRHPVRIAAQRIGVTPHVLRAWERRHQVVTPVRSAGGQRLYSDQDVERLRLLRQLTQRGHAIGPLATLPLEELGQLAEEEKLADRRHTDAAGPNDAVAFRSAAVRAAQCLAAGELKAVLERAAISLGVPAFLDQVAGPSIRAIGHGWSDGTISVGQEHLATTVFRRVLGWIIETFQPSQPAPRLLVATPAGQAHELGALMAGAAAAVEGWDVVYLGADLPAADILDAVGQVEARAVALSVVHPTENPALIDDLNAIRRQLSPDVHFFLGGSAVTRQPERFRAVGAQVLDSLEEFRSELRRIQERR